MVLLVALQEVLEPVDQVLERAWSKSEPLWWNETLEHAVGQVVESLRHTNLTDQSTLQVLEWGSHQDEEHIEALKLLEKHNLCWGWDFELLLDVEEIELLWELFLKFGGNLGDIVFFVEATTFATFAGLHEQHVQP